MLWRTDCSSPHDEWTVGVQTKDGLGLDKMHLGHPGHGWLCRSEALQSDLGRGPCV